jgi:hypothetical protein
LLGHFPGEAGSLARSLIAIGCPDCTTQPAIP